MRKLIFCGKLVFKIKNIFMVNPGIEHPDDWQVYFKNKYIGNVIHRAGIMIGTFPQNDGREIYTRNTNKIENCRDLLPEIAERFTAEYFAHPEEPQKTFDDMKANGSLRNSEMDMSNAIKEWTNSIEAAWRSIENA